MTDKEQELDRIVGRLGFRFVASKTRSKRRSGYRARLAYFSNPDKELFTFKHTRTEAKDALLAKLRAIVGPDPALTQRIAELEKEVEAARREGFEAVKSKAIDAMAIDIAADHPSKDGYDEALFSINSVADYLDDAYADYEKQKSLKG